MGNTYFRSGSIQVTATVYLSSSSLSKVIFILCRHQEPQVHRVYLKADNRCADESHKRHIQPFRHKVSGGGWLHIRRRTRLFLLKWRRKELRNLPWIAVRMMFPKGRREGQREASTGRRWKEWRWKLKIILKRRNLAGPRVPGTRRTRRRISDFHNPNYAWGCVIIKNGRELEFIYVVSIFCLIKTEEKRKGRCFLVYLCSNPCINFQAIRVLQFPLQGIIFKDSKGRRQHEKTLCFFSYCPYLFEFSFL